MFSGNYQVVDVLMLVGNTAPIALYFLFLGLVNSHARPCLISCRADFLTLSCVLAPILLWPLPVLLGGGHPWLLCLGLLLVAALFAWMLFSTGTGFVLYNIPEARCLRLLEEALHGIGLTGRWAGTTWQDDAARLSIHLRKFGLLRNVTLHIETHDPKARRLVPKLEAELSRRLPSVAMLPSTMGACLVLIGVSLMILPMWMVGRHIHDLVDAMTCLLR